LKACLLQLGSRLFYCESKVPGLKRGCFGCKAGSLKMEWMRFQKRLRLSEMKARCSDFECDAMVIE
jgi:hypothetical protein